MNTYTVIRTGRMNVVCMDCKLDLGKAACAPQNDGSVSHGLCEVCEAVRRRELELATV